MNIVIKLRNLFRKKRIEYLGRAGMIFDIDGNKYFVNSELLIGKPDIVIFWKDIYPYDQKQIVLNDDFKKKIATEVKKELEKDGLRIELSPDFW